MTVLRFLEIVRAAGYTVIVVALAVFVCAACAEAFRNSRDRERRRKLERERIQREYTELFTKKGK